MKLFNLSILVFALYAQLHTGVLSFTEGTNTWNPDNWQNDPTESELILRFDDLLKHSKSQQFHGLMGRSLDKSDMSKPTQLGCKRNKGEMFVGLMGKRLLKGDLKDELEKPQ